jgi:RHS repeat-associated protein
LAATRTAPTTTANCGKPVCTWDAFGPKTYTRPDKEHRQDGDGDDDPPVFTDTFSVQNTATKYTLHVVAGEHATTVIFLNGRRIIDEDDFHKRHDDGDHDRDDCSGRDQREKKDCDFHAEQATVDKPVILQLANTLKVKVLGKPGSSIVVSVIGVDNDAPVISATAAPAPDSFGWNKTSVLVTFTCSDATSGIATCPSPITVSHEGSNQIVSGTAIDRAGNTASTSAVVNLDETAPTVAAQIAPPPNTAHWNNTSVTVSFNCADALSGVASCSAPVSLSNEGAGQMVTGTAVDKAGNSANATATVNIDKTPPVIAITFPPNNSVASSALLQVSGTVTDVLSGVANVSCNGSAAVVQSGGFSCSVTLTPGANTISVLAVDMAGNVATQSIVVSFATPVIADFSPKSAAIGALVTVNGSNLTTGATTIVSLNGQGGGTIAAPVASASPTSVSFVIPAGAASGPITVTAGGISATSADVLHVLPGSSFVLTVGPSTASVVQGTSVAYAVSLGSSNGFSQLASLSLSGLPSAATASFSPQQITAGQFSILTVSVPTGQSSGTSSLTISASATVDGIVSTQSASANLIVQTATTSLIGRTVNSDTDETPLAGITISFLGVDDAGHTTGCSGQTRSDAAGNFAFTNPGSSCLGRQLVAYNGNTATDGEKYASVNLAYTLTAGQITGPELVHLPDISDAETIMVKQNARADQVFSYKTIPGVIVTVYAGTIFTEPDGSQPDPFPMAAVMVPVDRLPDNPTPNPGTLRATIVAFQPADTTSNFPVSVTFPNVLNNPPGANLELDTLDPVVGELVKYGTGTVSQDALKIVPDFDPAHPGHRFGISHFDWHGPQVNPPNQNNPCTSPPCPGGGDPVDLASGLLVVNKTDISFGTTRGTVAITRTYRTLSTAPGPFGIGTNHNYGYQLDNSDLLRGTGSFVNLVSPDGNQLKLTRQPNGTFANSSIPSLQGAVLSPPNFGTTTLRWRNGTMYYFGPNGGNLSSVLIAIADPNGNITTFKRGNAAQPTQITQIVDPVGNALNFDYDDSNRIVSITDPIGRQIRYTYNTQGTLATVTDAAGGLTTYAYDAQNRMTSITDPRGIQFLQNVYDANGRVIQQTAADGGITNFAYTLLNPGVPNSPVLLTAVTDPLGKTTTYHYSPQSQLLDVADALGERTIYALDPQTNQTISTTDPLGRVTAFGYDAAGNVTTVTRLAGTAAAATTSFTYDPVFSKPTSITDASGHTTSMTYDTNGNLTSMKDPLGHGSTFEYDKNGEVISSTDSLGNRTLMGYTNGQLSSTTDALGNVTTHRTDAVGRLLSATSPLGETVSYIYSPLNQVVQTTNALGGASSFAYDANGNLLSVTDPLGHTVTYTRDAMDRLSTRTDALSRTQTYKYDLDSNLTQVTDRRGKITTYQYDGLNRLILTGFGATGSSFESTLAMEYDAGGRVINLLDSSAGAIAMKYDELDRTTSQITPQGSITYGYGKIGARTSLTIAGQSPVSYSYDAANRLEQITQGSSNIHFSYDEANRRTLLALPNGIQVSYSYDKNSNVTGMSYALGPITLGNLTYTYDQMKRRVQVGGSFARTDLPAAVASATYDAANELTNWNGTAIPFDNNGNMLADAAGHTFTWNARNQVSVLNNASVTYDALGHRVKNAAGTSFLYDGENATQELSGALPTANIWTGGIDEFFQRTDGNGTVSPLADALGSTIALVNPSGSIVTSYTYDPYGNTTSAGTANSNPLQYTGRENDGSGLYFYRARYYSPLLGRFISEDPIGMAGSGANLYAYAGNNPINFRDSEGLEGRDDPNMDQIHDTLAKIKADLAPLDDFYAQQAARNAQELAARKNRKSWGQCMMDHAQDFSAAGLVDLTVQAAGGPDLGFRDSFGGQLLGGNHIMGLVSAFAGSGREQAVATTAYATESTAFQTSAAAQVAYQTSFNYTQNAIPMIGGGGPSVATQGAINANRLGNALSPVADVAESASNILNWGLGLPFRLAVDLGFTGAEALACISDLR